MTLPPVFLERPIAHRALHDTRARRPENSRAAAFAALEQGYGIEIDLQLSADGQAMVFHDDILDRLTSATGPVRAQSAAALGKIALEHGNETIPTLPEYFSLIAGRAPLLIELKDQSGDLGATCGRLEAATARALTAYHGPVALMSFNPHMVSTLARLAPQIPRGLVGCGFTAEDWPDLPEEARERLRNLSLGPVEVSFISHNHQHLSMPAIASLKSHGIPVLCWTIRTPEEEAKARCIAGNITFEGYRP